MWESSPKEGLNEWMMVCVCLQLKFSAEGSFDWIGVVTQLNCQPSCFCYVMRQSVQDPSWRLWHFRNIEKTLIRKFCDGKEDCNYGGWFFYQMDRLNCSSWQLSTAEALITHWKVKYLLCAWYCDGHWNGSVNMTQSLLISGTLGKDKTWATSVQNQNPHNGNCSGRAFWMDMAPLVAQAGNHYSWART